MACFNGETGSLPFALSLSHNKLNGNANYNQKSPLKICTIEGGIFHPKILLSV